MSIFALLHAVSPAPAFSDWNFRLLRGLFHLLPHSATRDTVAQFLIANPLASTCVYAGVFYLYWRIDDEKTIWRRVQLLATIVAFCLAILATVAFRPWVGWPAPTLVPRFQHLYPEYFWNQGNLDCFPSHSTLVYLLVAAGFWPLSRSVSALLMLSVLMLVSLPRVYVGGHYPVDIVGGIILAFLAKWTAHAVCRLTKVRAALAQVATKGLWIEAFLFLWLFELGEGFRSSFWVLGIVAKAALGIR